MGWWESEDGSGIVGDRPADILGTALEHALGEGFDTDLFAGFLAATGAALLRNPAALLSDVPLPGGLAFVAELDDAPPIEVPVRPAPVWTSLEDELYDALEAVAFQYRLSDADRAPRLAELLETIAFVARGHVVEPGTGRSLTLRGVYARARDARHRRDEHDAADAAAEALRLAALRALVELAAAATPEIERVVAGALEDPDWRVRMAAVLAVGRLQLSRLANRARGAAVPAAGGRLGENDRRGGNDRLSEDDRRALLALRDAAAARAEGSTLRQQRPVHPDPGLAARRAAFVDEVDAFVGGTALPAPDGPAAILRRLVERNGA
jgi:hypothetical protein